MELTLEIFFRTAIIFGFIVGASRFIGKRHLGQMNIYDLAMVMLVSNAVQNAMTRGAGDLAVGLVSASTLLAMGWLATLVFRRSTKVATMVIGSPTLICYDGVLREDIMHRESLEQDDIDRACREAGIEGCGEAQMIVLEVDGTLSVVPKS